MTAIHRLAHVLMLNRSEVRFCDLDPRYLCDRCECGLWRHTHDQSAPVAAPC